MKRLLFGGCLLAFPIALLAQAVQPTPDELQARIQDVFARHTIVIAGSENPSAIPLGVKLEIIFLELGKDFEQATDASTRQMAAQRFTATERDHQILRQSALNNAESRALLRAANAENDRVCPRILDGSIQGGPAIAAYFESLVQQRHARVESHYRDIVDQLSPAARARALTTAADEAVASARHVIVDHVGIAAEIPDLYEEIMKARCRRADAREAGGGIRTGRIDQP